MIIQVGTRERPIIQEVVEADPDAHLGDVAHEGYDEDLCRIDGVGAPVRCCTTRHRRVEGAVTDAAS